MPVTNYYSVGGEILGEETGGVRRDYLTDALGSVTGTVTSAGAIENTYRYKPYGAQLSKTGSAADPAFTWVGERGYRQTASIYSNVYIRARHYNTSSGTWNSKDPIFPTIIQRMLLFSFMTTPFADETNVFLYSFANPVTKFDSSGLYVRFEKCPLPDPLPRDEVNCGGAGAITNCNVKKGCVYTIICNRACDAPCTDAHEGQHRYDLSECCLRLTKCRSKHLGDRRRRRKCLDLYNAWAGHHYLECQAYLSGLTCRKKMWKDKGCEGKMATDGCCHHLLGAIQRDYEHLWYCNPFPKKISCPLGPKGQLPGE